MFRSDERVKLAEDNKIKDKAQVKTRGDAKGVTLGFNTSEKPDVVIAEFDSGDLIKKEILFRKF